MLNDFSMLDRNVIGTAPNWDRLNYAGFLEIRDSTELSEETGIRPFSGYGSLLNLKNKLAMMQIASHPQKGVYVRSAQGSSVNLDNVAWAQVYTTQHKPTFVDINSKGDYNTATPISELPVGISFIELPGTPAVEGDPIYSTCLTVYGSENRAFQLVVNNGQKPQMQIRSIHSNNNSTAGKGYGDWATVALRDGIIASAEKLLSSRTFTIADNEQLNHGPATWFNGAENVVLKLPTTIKGNVTGYAYYLDNGEGAIINVQDKNNPTLCAFAQTKNIWAINKNPSSQNLLVHYYKDDGSWEKQETILTSATGLQLSGGTLTGNLEAPGVSIKGNYPNYVFKDTNDNISAAILANTSTNQIYFYSRNKNNNIWNGQESYWLPTPDLTNEESKRYNILTTKNTITIPQGGTGATTIENARQNLLNLGSNVITTTTDDTVVKWGAYKGISMSMYTETGQLNDQPSRYGILVNFGQSVSEVHQLWLTQSQGTIYHRGGNGSGWGTNSWIALLDSNNYKTYCTPANIGAATSSHSHDRIISGNYQVKTYSNEGSDNRIGFVSTNTNKNNTFYWMATDTTATAKLRYVLYNNGSSVADGYVYTTNNKPTCTDIGAATADHTHSIMPAYHMANTSGVYVYTENNNTSMCWRTGTSSAYKYFNMNSDGNFYINGNTALHSGNYSTYCAPASHTHSYYPLTGGFLNGMLYVAANGWPQIGLYNASQQHQALIYSNTADGSLNTGLYLRCYTGLTADTYVQAYLYTDGSWRANSVYGAVWNDYAEYRAGDGSEPGRVVQETEKGILRMTTKRLEPGCEIVSDTFGFAIGETDDCKMPVACSGRVLAYPFEDRYSYNPGDAVCSGPNGTVSKMTREEIMMYPERIIGTVSEIPEYDTWGTGNVKVNNRIWIRIR